MARFRSTMQGQRGLASRLGSKASGMRVNVNGWDSGLRIVARVDRQGRDTFDVYASGGSNDANVLTHLLTLQGSGVILTGATEYARRGDRVLVNARR